MLINVGIPTPAQVIVEETNINNYINIKTFGAKGDGFNDDTLAFQTALLYLDKYEGTLFIPNGTYIITSQLYLHNSNVIIKGEGNTILDGSKIPHGASLTSAILFNIQGTINSGIPVTQDITQWTNTVRTDTTGLKAGDLIFIRNDELYTPGTTNNTWKKGEIHEVSMIDSSTQLTTKDNCIFSYSSSQNLTVAKINPIENLVFENIKIKMGGVGSVHNAIVVKFGKNISFKNVTIEKAEDTAINLQVVKKAIIENCTFIESTSPAVEIGNTGYGICLVEGSRDIMVRNNTFKKCRHGVTGGGIRPTIFVDVIGCQGFNSIGSCYDCHEPTFYWNFLNNSGKNNQGDFTIRGQYIVVDGNMSVASLDKAISVYSFTPVAEQYGVIIRNNTILNSKNAGIDANGEFGTLRKIVIENNYINGINVSGCGIRLLNFISAIVKGNFTEDINNTGINIDVSVNTPGFLNSKLYFINNVHEKTNGSFTGIQIFKTDDVIYENNTCILSDNCIIKNCTNINVSGGRFSNKIYCLQIDTCNRVNINGGLFIGYASQDANADGIRIVNSNDINVNNTISYLNKRYGIYITTSTNTILIGNNAKGNLGATKISTDASTQVLTNNIV